MPEREDQDNRWVGWDDPDVVSWWQAEFTEGADAEYLEQILPLAAEHLKGVESVLDVGCGEGQVARMAAGLPGVSFVAGVDPTWGQLVVAADRGLGRLTAPADLGEQLAEANGGGDALPGAPDPGADVPAADHTGATPAADRGSRLAYVGADAAGLPFSPNAFDAVVACLVFEHIDEMDAAIAEVSRVLRPGGRFLFFLNHPLLQTPGSGWIDDRILDEQYWRIGPYLVEDKTLEEVEKGVWIPFVHRPLSRYVNAMVAAGMLVTRMEEPAPPAGFLARAHEYAEAATIPRLLLLRAEKQPAETR